MPLPWWTRNLNLDKTLLFDTSKIDEKLIMDKIIQALLPDNDDLYIEHPEGSNSFTLKREDRRWKKFLLKAKNVLKNFKTDPNNVLLSEEKIDNRLLKKLKKSKNDKDSLLLKLIESVEQFDNGEKVTTRLDYVEKREIDRSTLHSFDGPFELIHADVGNLELLGKSATLPRYVLLVVDFYSSKVYVNSMCSRKQVLQKMKQFYEDI